MLAHLPYSEYRTDDNGKEDPPEALYEAAQPHHDAGGQREGDTQSGKEAGEERDDPFEQRADDQAGKTDDCDGINQGRFYRRLQTHRFFDVKGETLKDDIENTAGFTGLDHVCGQVVKHSGI